MKQSRCTNAWTDRDSKLLHPDCLSTILSFISEQEPGVEILEIFGARSKIVEVGYDTVVNVKTASNSTYRLVLWFDLERFHVKEFEKL
ncbi:Hypothetical protein GLP15_4840 [Giardia lamblia P15]|uniref:Uncharacterized protein n=1 Tax=Giardia intestinalis (strain P15) TaxID=658858 RepID=E1EYD0_GIAIA|nr:Hypothetical protein GLP15_4840 [Giardia lamblia P15]